MISTLIQVDHLPRTVKVCTNGFTNKRKQEYVLEGIREWYTGAAQTGKGIGCPANVCPVACVERWRRFGGHSGVETRF